LQDQGPNYDSQLGMTKQVLGRGLVYKLVQSRDGGCHMQKMKSKVAFTRSKMKGTTHVLHDICLNKRVVCFA